jgi:hypothetical protein
VRREKGGRMEEAKREEGREGGWRREREEGEERGKRPHNF